jgi:NAD-dependent SIR2 family protein deacetylase
MDVYLFGAGASAPYGAPTMNGFLREAFAPWSVIPPERTSHDEDLLLVAKAIDKQYGIDLAKAQRGGDHFSYGAAVALEKINLEELLAMADETNNSELRHRLERVIYKTLERSVEKAMLSRDPTREYETLVKQLVVSRNKVCLISFNYDWMLDRALVDAHNTTRVSWTYALPFDAGIENFPSYRNVDYPMVYLLKLHGSVNWVQCVKCKNLRLYYFTCYDDAFRTSWPECQSCRGTNINPVLVAPTPLKNIPDAMNPAWDKAAKCLREARSLTVIGYSFPAFDRKARDLFLRNFIVPNLYSDSRPKLTIAMRDECIRKAIKAWFLPAVDRDVNEYCSFEEYCAVLQKSLKG